MSRLLLVVLSSLSATIAGCAVHGLQNDQGKIRHALLDLYTNQIMDNLVRQYNGLPIIQLDYGNATAQVTIKDSTGLMDSLVTGNPGVLRVLAGSTATVLKTTMNTVTGNASADRANQVSVTATPVTTSADVYNAYQDFLAIPGSLQTSCTPPPGAAHLCKKCGSTYYWVPAAYQKAFLALALATTAQRAQPLAGPDSFYVVNITDILRIESSTIKVKDEKNVTQVKTIPTIVATIDIKVPVDIGRIEMSLPSAKSAKPAAQPKPPAGGDTQGGGAAKTVTFDIAVVDRPDPPKIVQQSDQIKIFFDATAAAGALTGPNQLRTLLPIPAKLYLHRHRPVAPTGTEALNRIEFQLQQIQFNQLRNGF